MTIKIYPAVFETDPVGFGVYFPDVSGASTQGADLTEAYEMASDALGIMLADLIERGGDLPKASDVKKIETSENEFVSLVSVDLSEYLEMNKLVKKNLTIPLWADKRAKDMGLNFSQTLTEAILEKAEA